LPFRQVYWDFSYIAARALPAAAEVAAALAKSPKKPKTRHAKGGRLQGAVSGGRLDPLQALPDALLLVKVL
jgi:hypothetical protein